MRERADNPGKPNQIGSCGTGCLRETQSLPTHFPPGPHPRRASPERDRGGLCSSLTKLPNACFALFSKCQGSAFPDPLCKSGANEAFAIYTSLSSLKGGGVCAVCMIYLSALGKTLGLDPRHFLGLPRWDFLIQHQGKKSWKLPWKPSPG